MQGTSRRLRGRRTVHERKDRAEAIWIDMREQAMGCIGGHEKELASVDVVDGRG